MYAKFMYFLKFINISYQDSNIDIKSFSTFIFFVMFISFQFQLITYKY